MDDLRTRLEQLAERGLARGADAVLDGAVRDATAAGEAGGHEGMVVSLDDTPRRPVRPFRSAVAAAGFAALVGVMGLAISALSGGGGADSPEDAVRQLAGAIDGEDLLAAADALAPSEVRTLRATLDAASRRAAELALVEQASAPLAGLEVDVRDLQLETEVLADGFVKVHVRGGEATVAVRHGELSDLLKRVTTDDSDTSDSIALADTRPFDVDPFVVAVREGDRWYVSAAYTVLEYVRAVNDLPPADYGSGRTARLGADSPEEAARALADGIASRDWERVFAMMPPDEMPLYDYRDGLAQLLADVDVDFSIDSWSAQSRVDGDRAAIDVRAGGTYATGDDPDGRASWSLRSECLSIEDVYYDDFEDRTYTSDAGFCLVARGVMPYSVFFSAPPGDGPVRAHAVRRDGRWFVSPVGTALDHLDEWIARYDRRSILSLFDLVQDLPPDGQLTQGEPATAHLEGWGLAYAFTFEGRAGQRVVGQYEDAGGRAARYRHTRLFGPDGAETEDAWGLFEGQPARLPADGTYTLVLAGYTPEDVRFTLWDAEDAPPEALVTPDGCTTLPGGGVECPFDGPGSGEVCVSDGGGGVECSDSGSSDGGAHDDGSTATTAVAATGG